RTRPRLEQTIRADLWAKRGVVNVLSSAQLTKSVLAQHVMELLQRDLKPITPDLDLQGLTGVRERFAALLNGSFSHAVAVPVQ
ncbi:MAG: hypothetical protein ACE5HE_06305, partial [Phycisphaerae bacterium]